MELVFVLGPSMRRVFIKGRVVTFFTEETGNEPITIDIDKFDENHEQFDKLKDAQELIDEIKSLTTEQEIARDVIKDFQRSGWRMINKNV